MASASAYTLLLLSLPFLAAAQSPAPAPSPVTVPSPVAAPPPAALPDPAAILTKAGHFSILIDLLVKTNLVQPLLSQLNSEDGISIFAPTDDAFKKISATLAKLSDENVTTILTYHVLTQYVGVGQLESLGNPVETLAKGLTLNFTGGNVVTGVVTTKVGTPLYDNFPLGIFPVEAVLIPPTFAPVPAPAPAPSPKASGPSAAPPKASGPSARTPTISPPKSAASLKRVGWGAVAAAALACMSFF